MSWAAFVAGIAASLAANVAHAEPTAGARFVAGWAPVALLLTIEVMMRVPAPRPRVLRVSRYAGTAIVAGVAAIASFRHMRGLALQYGEDQLTANTLPLSVDGLVLVASIALLTLADRRRTVTAAAVVATAAMPPPVGSRPLATAATDRQAGRQPAVDAVDEPVVAAASADTSESGAAILTGTAGRGVDDAAPAAALARLVEQRPSSTVTAASPGLAAVGRQMNAVSDAVTMPATAVEVVPLPLPDGGGPSVPEPVSAVPGATAAGSEPALPLDMGPALSGLDDTTRQLYERAYRLFLDSVAARRALTGGELGTACGRGERWGRNRIADVKAAQRRQTAQQPLTVTAGR